MTGVMLQPWGPPYPKIPTVYERNDRGVMTPDKYAVPEFEYLYDVLWRWSEKIDGTNARIHWTGTGVKVGGKTDNAQVSAKLVANLDEDGLLDPALWQGALGDAPATIYGEGYGAGIQSGGQYRPDQHVIVFDVLIYGYWLSRENVADVAGKLGLGVVPEVGLMTLAQAAARVRDGVYTSAWPNAKLEGLVGRPYVDLFNRRGERIMAKIKTKDWRDYERLSAEAVVVEGKPGLGRLLKPSQEEAATPFHDASHWWRDGLLIRLGHWRRVWCERTNPYRRALWRIRTTWRDEPVE